MTIAGTVNRFQVGRVFSNAMGTLSRNVASLLVLAFVLGVLPGLANALLFRPLLLTQAGAQSAAAAAATASAIYGSPIFWLEVVIGIIAYSVLQAAIIYITVVDLDGRRPELATTIAIALRRAAPLFVLTLLFGLAVGLASILLIVPGMILGTMWSVAGPALVAERTGILASFGRSRALTKGSRWPIFGIFVVFLVGATLLVLVLGAVAGPVALAAPGNPGIVAAVVSAVGGAIETLVINVLLAAIYVELRTVKEGASTTSLAAIFA